MKETILITGCSSGIGRFCAEQLHKAGYNVVASCRSQEDVAALKQQGLNCIQLDLDDTDSIQQAIEACLALTGGRLDVLFNNAAYGQPGALEDLPTQALRQQFETNVFGWHELTRAVIPVMLKQGSGKIVQNSSVLGLVAMKYRGAYNASKFALEGYTDTLRLELQDTPLHVSLIEPGPIESHFRENAKLKFEQHIDMAASRHHASYKQTLDRLGKSSPSSKFTLAPDAVLKPLQAIIDSERPKPRYYVTQPTHIFGFLRRILPVSWLDQLLSKSN
ncbi:SDR family oxidoreductase [Photobacterium sp. OFAV2-7]|uniref:SDR family oxidoreductase n=1 Tax=Photobacterium sp. OFAV2-7 TaxID=2917748 RepID=UPI001EF68EE0|nr:SDR family oxidoreductase [Photobacterium sp. OFAV2-7]MCG7588290.1 SDR family oxidoreductase [Photobacterium sp. OFAV2-7]